MPPSGSPSRSACSARRDRHPPLAPARRRREGRQPPRPSRQCSARSARRQGPVGEGPTPAGRTRSGRRCHWPDPRAAPGPRRDGAPYSRSAARYPACVGLELPESRPSWQQPVVVANQISRARPGAPLRTGAEIGKRPEDGRVRRPRACRRHSGRALLRSDQSDASGRGAPRARAAGRSSSPGKLRASPPLRGGGPVRNLVARPGARVPVPMPWPGWCRKAEPAPGRQRRRGRAREAHGRAGHSNGVAVAPSSRTRRGAKSPEHAAPSASSALTAVSRR